MNITYSDSFRILANLTDVKLDFGMTEPRINTEGKIIGEDQTVQQRIILSVPLAKNLAYKLLKTIEDYEKNFGKVVDMIEIQEKQSGK